MVMEQRGGDAPGFRQDRATAPDMTKPNLTML